MLLPARIVAFVEDSLPLSFMAMASLNVMHEKSKDDATGMSLAAAPF
jgi:hypothetical protein